MMTETCEDSLMDLLETIYPHVSDQVYMRSIYLARLLDETDDIDELKVVVMSQLVSLADAVASLDAEIADIGHYLRMKHG